MVKENKKLLEILVVEDDEDYKQNAKDAQGYLGADYNVNITVVDNVVDALEEIKTKKYGMLVSDINIFAGKNLPKIDFSDKFEGFDFDKANEIVCDLVKKYTTEVIDSSNIKNRYNKLVSKESMNYAYKKFNKEIESWLNPESSAMIESIPVVLKAKEMGIPYGIVTRVHTLDNLGKYLALSLISEKEVAIGDVPTLLYYNTESEVPDKVHKKILNIGENLKSRVVGIQEQSNKTPEVWAQAIKNIIAYYNIN